MITINYQPSLIEIIFNSQFIKYFLISLIIFLFIKFVFDLVKKRNLAKNLVMILISMVLYFIYYLGHYVTNIGFITIPLIPTP
jgi:hypothetical protein